LVNAKGKMESDLNIYCLKDELLLDFEPGLSEKLQARFNNFIIADDVQVVDVSPHYGLLSVQGPKAEKLVRALVGAEKHIPPAPFNFSFLAPSFCSTQAEGEDLTGEIYCMNLSHGATVGFDL